MRSLLVAICATLVSMPGAAQVAESPIIRYEDRIHPQLGAAGMVASQNHLASAVGAEILEAGGNAVDAAVAVGFSLAVTLPRAGNLGGGGFMIIHDAESGADIAIDYREMAPRAATRDMYLDRKGDVDRSRATFSHLASGVPGTVAGLFKAHSEFGRLPWKRLLQPAIQQAREGVTMSYDLAQLLRMRKERMCRDKATCAYFYKPDGVPYEAGETFKQEDLAASLERIAEDGPDGFYRGKTAQLIAAEMARGGGLVDELSLAAYKPVVREPVRGTYRGYEIVTMPPPSSGGVHIIQMLNILEHFPVAELGAGSADNVHLLAEAARLAYADRSEHLGDPDYYDVPLDWLVSKEYAKELAATIDMQKARKSDDVKPGVAPQPESPDTTHYSVMDAEGNVVAVTTTLNFSFGSHISVAGAGFLLNNEMDDFVSKPGVPNAFGLLGGDANAIEAGKRPLSSMTPTFVLDDGEAWFATGSPGGSRIITTVLQMVVNMIDHEMNVAEATLAPRMHHQWYPDVLQLEEGFSPDTIKLLRERGHELKDVRSTMGSLQSVAFKDGMFRGAADTRRPNAASSAPDKTRDR